MFYRLLVNYLRIKLLRVILSRVMGSRFVKSKNLKNISILAFGLELLSSYMFKPGKK
ncbi:hypothetical protein TUM19329_08000 [Legionella antarctica]|uniref:Uncharacterized protein n=1 Tax=Legionella antarctica TaxID=2708020 RepID=A0A6F8T1Y1_9GAMM|nr:hypothetical protein TUM19329_08000 [Legionella antarctica]